MVVFLPNISKALIDRCNIEDDSRGDDEIAPLVDPNDVALIYLQGLGAAHFLELGYGAEGALSY
jgi:hypothetical protein